MSGFENRKESVGFACKLWRGERMVLLGFDVADPEPDLVGFSIEVKSPGASDFTALRNRIAFSYPQGAAGVDGNRNFDTRDAPIQKFRWIHFPWQPQDGTYTYRVAKRHMPKDGKVVAGTTLTLDIEQKAVTYDGVVDIGFTRNFASSQAYREQFGNREDVIPRRAEDGLTYPKIPVTNSRGESVYSWLGFEAHDLLFGFLDDALAGIARGEDLTLDAMAYDLNEPDVVDRLRRFGARLRVIVDDSPGDNTGHGASTSPETTAAERFRAAGARMMRTHFGNLQHHKVLILRRSGVPEAVLCGSTNFSWRGLYIQANNVLVFRSPDAAALFGRMFDLAFADPSTFAASDFAKTWHLVHGPGQPSLRFCFSPHDNSALSLDPVAAAIDQATSSVFYSVAFLGQTTSGPTRAAFDRLIDRPVFSCGTVDKKGGLALRKPDGALGVVDFAYLAKKAPQPFAAEWSGGQGRNIHHKFVVTDFSLPTAKVFTGSSNLAPTGEKGNGDHLIMIEDRKIATAYAIEGIRVFDHLQFRFRLSESAGSAPTAPAAPAVIALKKPTALSGQPAWFERSYVADSQARRDRVLFST